MNANIDTLSKSLSKVAFGKFFTIFYLVAFLLHKSSFLGGLKEEMVSDLKESNTTKLEGIGRFTFDNESNKVK